MTEQLIQLSSNSDSLALLYGLQAFTYAAAAILSKHAGHKSLCVCYSFSALIHVTLAAFHLSWSA